MKKIILVLIMLLICFSCGKRNIHKNNSYGMYGYEQIINTQQLDSICAADTLLAIDYWIESTFYDYETNQSYVKRMFIKDLSNDYEVTYILTEQDTLFKIIKRVGKIK